MPKVKPVKMLNKNIIDEFDYEKTKINVLNYFDKYRTYTLKKDYIESSYSATLGNDNLGIYSSNISDPTGRKAIKLVMYTEYLDNMNASLRKIKLKLTYEEKIILKLSILNSTSDEDVADAIGLDRSSLYTRKKSCFIKVALFYGLEVYK